MTDIDRLDQLAAKSLINRDGADEFFEDALVDAWPEIATELRRLRAVASAARRVYPTLQAVASAARRVYPTLHSHMIHCETTTRGDECSCGKRANDTALGRALAALERP